MTDKVELEVYHTNFVNPGYTMVRLPEHLLEEIDRECAGIMEKFEQHTQDQYNSQLIGQIENEFALKKTPEVLQNFLGMFCKHYYSHWTKREDVNQTFRIAESWVNFQKKHEYNPIHNHSGVLSFVLWLQIPYDVTEELSLPQSIKSNKPSASLFNFHYTNLNGDIAVNSIPVSKEHEGMLMLFPSWLNHSVNPFYTSDDYRISVSGNIVSDSEANYNLFV